jgi:hypothetical protein
MRQTAKSKRQKETLNVLANRVKLNLAHGNGTLTEKGLFSESSISVSEF